MRRQAGLGGVDASFYHPGTHGQGWEPAFQGLDSSPGKCGAVRDCRLRPGRKGTTGGGLEEREMTRTVIIVNVYPPLTCAKQAVECFHICYLFESSQFLG